MEIIKKYFSKENTSVLLLVFCIPLFAYCFNLYNSVKDSAGTIAAPYLYTGDSTLALLKNVKELDSLWREMSAGNLTRNQQEVASLTMLHSRDEINDTVIYNLYVSSAKWKRDVAVDEGILNKFANTNTTFFSYNYYEEPKSLLDIELSFIKNLERFAEFRMDHFPNDRFYESSERKIYEDCLDNLLSHLTKLGEVKDKLKRIKDDRSYEIAKEKFINDGKSVKESINYNQQLAIVSYWASILLTLVIIFLVIHLIKLNRDPKDTNSSSIY